MLIAIDGPGGVGKSTLAAGIAAETGLPHLDTGSTYRAATVAALDAGVDLGDESAVDAAVARVDIRIEDGLAFVDGRDITQRLRSEEVTDAVSVVAAHSDVRDRIVSLQRSWVASRGGAAVVEGRDIGTVVFPDADVKVFLTATPEVRARRRAGDQEAAGKHVDEIADDLARRDRIDSTREASPLRPAPDAMVIDTSELDVDEVRAIVLDLIAAAPDDHSAPGESR